MSNESSTIRRNRAQVYIGPRLRAALNKHKKRPLSVVVNTMAERYAGLLERCKRTPMMSFHAELYCNVLEEKGEPLTAAEIATFPAMVCDYLDRHPEFPQGPGRTAHMIVTNSSFLDLVSLVEEMERCQ